MSRVKINVDLIYPVGSVYITTNDINPGSYFGGTWEQIAKGRTLVGVNPDETEFNQVKKTGGEKEVTLTEEQMPRHWHKFPINSKGNGKEHYPQWTIYTEWGGQISSANGDDFVSIWPSSAGEDKPHNNMPPYFTCYIWNRIA